MILYLTLFLFLLNFILLFKLFSHINFFLIFLFISQDYFGWYPADYIMVMKYKGDILFTISLIYIYINFRDKILEEIISVIKPIYITYFSFFCIYLSFYFLNIYGENKNLLASRIIFYIPILLTAFTLCINNNLKSIFFLNNYEKIIFIMSLIILAMNFIIYNYPYHTTFFNGDLFMVRIDRIRVLQGGMACVVLILLSKSLLVSKIKRSTINTIFLYLTIISNYIIIGIIGHGRTLLLCSTIAVIFSSFLNKPLFRLILFFLAIAFFITSYSELYNFSLLKLNLQDDNGQFRVELLLFVYDTIRSNIFLGLGIQNVDCSTCLNLPLTDIGIFREIYYYGFLGTLLLLVGIIFSIQKIYKSHLLNLNFKDLFISVCIFMTLTLPTISFLTRFDLIIILGVMFAFLISDPKIFKKTKNEI